jgi:hypothetical protein
MDKLLAKILSIGRTFFPFIAGMIVSGYFVEISVNPESNRYHCYFVTIGLIIVFCLVILIVLCEKVEQQKRFGKDKSDSEALENAKKDCPNIGCFSWGCILIVIILSVAGTCCLKKANQEQQSNIIKEQIVRDTIIIHKTDSLFQIYLQTYDRIQEKRFEKLSDIDSLLLYEIEILKDQLKQRLQE